MGILYRNEARERNLAVRTAGNGENLDGKADRQDAQCQGAEDCQRTSGTLYQNLVVSNRRVAKKCDNYYTQNVSGGHKKPGQNFRIHLKVPNEIDY